MENHIFGKHIIQKGDGLHATISTTRHFSWRDPRRHDQKEDRGFR